MLIEFSVSNFLSFREKVTLSLVKGKGTELEETNTVSANAPSTPDLLRGAVVFGANSAGKSNLIKALGVMQGLVEDSAKESQSGEPLDVTPFLFDDYSSKKPSEFEVVFVNDGVRYQYGFSANHERIVEEWLYAYPKGRPQRWIERIFNNESQTYVWGTMDKLTGQKQVWQEATRSNALFLSTAIQLNNQQLSPVFEWFSEILRIAGIGTWSPGFSMKLCDKDESKEKIIDFLKAADVNINDVEVTKKKFNSEDLPGDIPGTIRRDLLKKLNGESIIKIKTVHYTESGKKVLLDLKDESDGTQKIFALAGPWLDSLGNGYTLVIDELHDNLHPLMVKFLVTLFNRQETNPNNAQLIFTTHDTSVLDQDIFRRDQIWFCEKNDVQTTNLYPLTDFNPRKKVENLERGYLMGRYGALPYITGLKAGSW